jgi:hypothetical protein
LVAGGGSAAGGTAGGGDAKAEADARRSNVPAAAVRRQSAFIGFPPLLRQSSLRRCAGDGVGNSGGAVRPAKEVAMAKGQQRSNREARKPKKAKVKTNVSQPSQKAGVGGIGKKD